MDRKRPSQQPRAASPAPAVLQRKSGTRGRPAAGEIEHRRREIITVARRIFGSRGFARTTVEDIARAAGVGKITIYEHIGDKAELFRIAYGTPPSMDGEWHFDLPPGTRSGRKALIYLASQLVRYVLSPDSLAIERALMTASDQFPDLAREVIGSATAAFLGKLSRVLDDLIARRLLSSTDTARAAEYFYEVIAAADAYKALLGYPVEPPNEAEIGKRVNLFLYGYVGGPRSGGA
jgi:TetR/AcrR family transcriptional regulator, mexJK operon transcriptional repressor